MEEQLMAKKNLIYKTIVGSKLYGTFTEDSDTDYIGVFVPDKDYVLGIKRCEQVEDKTNPSSSVKANTKADVDSVIITSRPRALATDIDGIRAFAGKPFCMFDGPIQRSELASIGKRIRRDIQDSHDEDTLGSKIP